MTAPALAPRRLAALGARVAVRGPTGEALLWDLRRDARVVVLGPVQDGRSGADAVCRDDAWPVASGSLSGVLLVLANGEAAPLREIARVLEPGGRLLWCAPLERAPKRGEIPSGVARTLSDAGLEAVAAEALARSKADTPAGALARRWERLRARLSSGPVEAVVVARRPGGAATSLEQLPGFGSALRSMFLPRLPRRR